ncbi:hypothetical protein MyxoNM_15645 [Myxococcus xanthus]|nr:hypothetical protein MyxoNM_15645 [Myxococcus xanthus]SDX70824.1 hypothetical protein SAMN05444383_111146 [Myxococcus xanthus]
MRRWPREHPRRNTHPLARPRSPPIRRPGLRRSGAHRRKRRPSRHTLPRRQPRRRRPSTGPLQSHRHTRGHSNSWRGNTTIKVLGHSRHVLDDLALLQHLPFLQEVNLLRGRRLQRERRRRHGTRRLRRRESRRRGRPRPPTRWRQRRRHGHLGRPPPPPAVLPEINPRHRRRGRRQRVQRMRAPRHGRFPPDRAGILGLRVRVIAAQVLPGREPTEHPFRLGLRSHGRGRWRRHAQRGGHRRERHGRRHGRGPIRTLRRGHLDETRLALDAVAKLLELEQPQLRRDVRNDAQTRDEPQRIRVLDFQRAGHRHLEPPAFLLQREGLVLLRHRRGKQLQHRVRCRHEVRFLRHRVAAHLPQHHGQGVDVEDVQLDKVGAQPSAVDELGPEGFVELRLCDEALADQDRSELFGHVRPILDAFSATETPLPPHGRGMPARPHDRRHGHLRRVKPRPWPKPHAATENRHSP